MRLITYSMERPRRGARSSGPRPSPREPAPDAANRVVEVVHHALLQRDDGVVGDVDRLGADLRTALGDVAVADAGLVLQVAAARGDIERVHLEARDTHQEARAGEGVRALVVAQHVAHVLAEEALDALAELLHPVDVRLLHAPGAVGLGGLRLKGRDALVDLVVPGDVGHQVLDHREGLHGREGDRLTRGELVHARHAHEARPAVHLGAARAAPPSLAVPAAGEVARQVGLHVVHGVEDDHALVLRHRVVLEGARLAVAAEDAQQGVRQTSPSTTRLSSSGRGGMGPCPTVIRSPCRRTITSIVPKCLSESGCSTRMWAPRLSRRSSAARVTASLTVRRFFRSIAVFQPGLYWRLPSTSAVSMRGSPRNALAYAAAPIPARRPNTSRSESELPPRRFAP